MSTHKISMPALKAALSCASKDAARECICAVFIEFNQTETLYVATDGVCIGCVKAEAQNADLARFLMRADVVKKILKLAGAMKATAGEATLSSEPGKKTLSVFGNSFTESPYQFPNWRQVFPKADWACYGGGGNEAVHGIASGIAEKAGAFWSALDHKSFAVLVPVGQSPSRTYGFLGLYSTQRGERSKLPGGIRATFYAVGCREPEELRKNAAGSVSYFPTV